MTHTTLPRPLLVESLTQPGKDRDLERLHLVFDEHYPSVWRFLRRLGLSEADADDLAQHAFLVTAERASEVRRGCERAFVFGCAVRLSQGERRRRGREELDPEASEPQEATPESLLEEKQARELFDALVAKLDLEQRIPFLLYEVEGLTLPEVADALNIPVGTATSRLRRARQNFSRLVERVKHREAFGRSA